MTIFSCRYCTAPKRHPGCHSTCPEYLKDKAEHERRKEQLDKERAVQNAIYEQRSIHVRKALKNRRGGYSHVERF